MCVCKYTFYATFFLSEQFMDGEQLCQAAGCGASPGAGETCQTRTPEPLFGVLS